MARFASAVESFLDRPPRSPFSDFARIPRTLRPATPEETVREVAVAYSVANFAVYRSIVERLSGNEKFRMETQFGDFEMTAAQFERSFPGIASSASYRTGTASSPNGCYYVVGPPPSAAYQFRRA